MNIAHGLMSTIVVLSFQLAEVNIGTWRLRFGQVRRARAFPRTEMQDNILHYFERSSLKRAPTLQQSLDSTRHTLHPDNTLQKLCRFLTLPSPSVHSTSLSGLAKTLTAKLAQSTLPTCFETKPSWATRLSYFLNPFL